MDFFDDAACLGMEPEMFFEGFEEATYDEKMATIAICNNCPVTSECYEFGLSQTYGLWGGVFRSNGKELQIRRKRKKRKLDMDVSNVVEFTLID